MVTSKEWSVTPECRTVTDMPAHPIRVALVNDHPLVVHGLLGLLTPHADQVRVVELDSQLDVSQTVDIALYDTFTMDGPERPTLLRLLADPHVARVVVYTWNASPDLVESTLGLGVAGVVSKSVDSPDLVDALVAVHRGDVVTPGTIAGAWDSDDNGKMREWPGREQGLTAREAEIISLITMGYSNLEIAERTFLSINSVKSYIRTAYRTMGVTNRSRAILWGLENGMRPRAERVKGPASA